MQCPFLYGEGGDWGGRTPEWGSNSFPLFRSPKRRKSNASEFMCNQPDEPARNSPLQEAKHVP
ncbi:MAG: hypothetical protein OSJ62_09215, partial [Lachnospiraceae bacterium]|nr:hypothetical protein [Lachnospiraceae bacterium]